MKSTGGRIAVLIGVVVLVVAAFLILRPTEDEGGGAPVAQETDGGSSGGGQGGGGGGGDEPKPKPKPEPAATEIEVKDGSPVGGVENVEVEKGDDVELVVVSDVEDEVHVHGYDEYIDVSPGKPARVDFTADLEGIFEIELHGSHAEIARLEVSP